MNSIPIYYKYWGKAEKGGNNFHLLPYHCLDVAAVGYKLITENAYLRHKFLDLTGLDEGTCLSWIVSFLCLHDAGKFTESFQGLRNDLLQQLQEKESQRHYIRHDQLGYLLWEQKLCIRENLHLWFGLQVNDIDVGKWNRAVQWFAKPMIGHHGEPPRKEGPNGIQLRIENYCCDQDIKAAKSFMDDVANTLRRNVPAPTKLPDYSKHLKARWELASWFLAGFTVLCDWIGSNNQWFPYSGVGKPLYEYWERQALPQADRAIKESGISMNLQSLNKISFSKLFQNLIKLTPLQGFTAECAIETSPQLFILEDVTGSGKTEAALFLARRLMAKGAGKGIFIALPTMATSNAMYGRLETVYRLLFQDDFNPSLVLAHGSRHLSATFLQSITHPDRQRQQETYGTEDEPATAQCSAWLADNRKKALLADIGVGTLDQALLAILPSRFQSLRLLGLCGAILIVDEVHAYDPYMNRLLQTLLTFHARFGGSAILLSATLPHHVRQQMISSFAKGLETEQRSQVSSNYYPLATTVTRPGTVIETPIEAVSHRRTSIEVRIVCEQEKIERSIATASLEGKCVCWIRNTVHDAIQGYSNLKKLVGTENLTLFHARFAMGDRLDIEKYVCATFGKESSETQRSGKILIATQVVEQSLDLDFDLLISDLAPMDLLIQRSGRLHRHLRDERGNLLPSGTDKDRRESPCFVIHSPVPSDEADGNWFKKAFPKASYVYPSHGCLWLTAKLLQDRGILRIPDDARELIEAAFTEEADKRIPPSLRQRDFEAEGEMMRDTSLAHINMLKIEEGYTATPNQWREDMRTPTRLGDTETTVRLARWDGTRLLPWYDTEVFPWDMSQVHIRTAKVASEAIQKDPNLAKAIENLKCDLPDKGKWSLLVAVSPVGDGTWQGEAQNRNGSPVVLTYSPETGVQVSRKE